MELLTCSTSGNYTLNSTNKNQNEMLMMSQILRLSKTPMMAERYSIYLRCCQFLKSLRHFIYANYV